MISASHPTSIVTALTALVIVGIGVFKVLHYWKDSKRAFDPNQTDVFNYSGFRFAREYAPGETLTITWGRLFPTFSVKDLTFDDVDYDDGTLDLTVDILDATKKPHLTFDENGFTLVDLLVNENENKSYYEPTSWKAMDQLNRFLSTTVLKDELKKLYPNATRFEPATKGKVRGKMTSAPAPVNGIHIDFLADTDTADRFYSGHSHTNALNDAIKRSERNEDDEVLDAIVSIWKPIDMTGPVCDKPLALMDASTYRAEEQRPYYVHVDLWPFVKKDDVIAVPAHSESQKWYYYPFMTSDQVLLFSQYDRKKGFFSVPHGAFLNPNCPPGLETRSSVDFRVLVYSAAPPNGKRIDADSVADS